MRMYFSVIFIILVVKINCESLNEYQTAEQKLMTDLLASYNKNIRPSPKLTGDLLLYIRQITSLDEKNQIMTSSCYFSEKWIDPRLKWNPADYNNVKMFYVPVKNIWIPDLMVVNTADSNGFLTVNDYNLASVFSNGTVYVLLTAISLRTRCKMDVRKFPFDTQNCPVTISSWGQTKDRIDFDTSTKNIDNNSYVINSVWDLTNITLNISSNYDRYPNEPFPVEELTFIFTLKRWPLYYMITGIFPCFVLNLVTLLSYTLPYVLQINLCKWVYL